MFSSFSSYCVEHSKLVGTYRSVSPPIAPARTPAIQHKHGREWHRVAVPPTTFHDWGYGLKNPLSPQCSMHAIE